MMKMPSALVLVAIAFVGCSGVDSAEPRAAVDQTAAQKPPIAANQTATPATPGTPDPSQPGVNPVGAAALEFKKHVDAYMKVHNEAEEKVPNLKRTDDPAEIASREKALAQMIMTLRAGAQPGEVFAKEYQPYFIQIVQDDFAKRSAADRRALVQELPKNLKLDVNTVYPTTLPLATFPAALLRKLPDLPPELEYRIVGRSLILRDVKANLIVDILRDVVPIPT
jgi:hypothetical protein